MLMRICLFTVLTSVVNICLADTITISCIRDIPRFGVSHKDDVRFTFDTSSDIGEVRYKGKNEEVWKRHSADVTRSEKDIILFSKSKYSTKYWISRTSLRVRETDPRVTFIDCKMHREKTQKSLF